MSNAELKYKKLVADLKSLKSAGIAFSGGVDSTLLLYAAREALGDNIVAVTAVSPLVPQFEKVDAESFCGKLGVRQNCFVFDALSLEVFKNNPPDRCYHCKKAIFSQILKIAEDEKLAAVCEGSNMDDLNDYRPGLKAIEELGIRSPLREAGLYKSEIRELLKARNISVWEKPSFACLASRFACGEEITAERLSMVEKAEQMLRSCGFEQLRVRIHGELARIEVLPQDIERLASTQIRNTVADRLKALGFRYVTLDICGYKTGSMNPEN